MKQRTKIGKTKAFQAKERKIKTEINELLTNLNYIYGELFNAEVKTYHYPSNNIKNQQIKPDYFADLVFTIGNSFFVLKFINRQFPIDINTKTWQEKITDKNIDQNTSGIKNWYDITQTIKFKLLESEFKGLLGYNCVILNKLPLGRNTDHMAFIGLLDHFDTWLSKVVVTNLKKINHQFSKPSYLENNIENQEAVSD